MDLDMEALVPLGVLAAVSVLLGLPGSNWGALLPGVVAFFGGLMYLLGEPSERGEELDPQRLIGGLFFMGGVGSALAVLAVAAVVRSVRRERERQRGEQERVPL